MNITTSRLTAWYPPVEMLSRRSHENCDHMEAVGGRVCDMNAPLPQSYLVRHGETAWSLSGRHTGLTDVPLTGHGEESARRLGRRLNGLAFRHVFTSPLLRAERTCALAGFGQEARTDHDLVEWDYGDYEGKTTAEIRLQRPAWDIFRDGSPGGESLAQVARRADRVAVRLRAMDGDALIVSHGHFLRVLAARWLGLDPVAGRSFFLSAGALCIIGYGHDRDEPVIRLWNDDSHVHHANARHRNG